MFMLAVAPIFAVASSTVMVSLLVQVIIVGLIAWLLWWFVGWVGLPEPFNKIAMVVIGLFAVVFLINVLLRVGVL